MHAEGSWVGKKSRRGEPGFKFGERNIDNLCCADDTTLITRDANH